MYLTRCLTVEVDLEETLHRTDARASMSFRGMRLTGYGYARRHPSDENNPTIGEELASARALADLAQQLRIAAELTMDAQERPAQLADA
jgi:hypothetical protein